MKLDPKPQPAQCDRCGKTTTKYYEMEMIRPFEGVNTETGKALKDPIKTDAQMAAVLALHLGIKDACESCWSIIQSCVTRAGKVQARTKKGGAA